VKDKIALLDDILDANKARLGDDYPGYRNHTDRVANICLALAPESAAELDKLAVATAYHDLGIWTAGTFDYLRPSRDLASDHLVRHGHAKWLEEIDAMILEHHKLTRYRVQPGWLVEPFRKADLVDVSLGFVRFGIARSFIRELYEAWPGEGFHRKLVLLTLAQTRAHPFKPLPMLRL
jgi:hypothetical protein